MKLNALTCTDSYKLGHYAMYADGTTKVYSNLTPRSDKIYRQRATNFYDGKVVVLGIQGAVQEIKEMFDESFFSQPKDTAITKYKRRCDGHLGPNVISTKHIEALHDIGFLPILIKALPEGTKIKPSIPVMTVTNTVPEAYWVVNYLETVLSDLIWKSCTNATIAAEYKAICKHYADITGTDDFSVSIQCHEFAQRGMSGPEDAARAGFAHLTSFIGTDTLPAMDYAEMYYDADPDSLIAISVPATEHAVATSNILGIQQRANLGGEDALLVSELKFMNDLITRKFPTGIVSYVADSFDFWAVLTKILPQLKDTILAREASAVAPAKLVIRPDSGDPVKVVCGYEAGVDGYWAHSDCTGVRLEKTVFIDNNGDEVPDHEVKGAIEVLWEVFGGTETATGYKLLDSHIGLIYGDSITTKRAEEILRRLEAKGFASGNVVFGVGSYTYQCNTRDTFGFAVKATYTEVEGKGIAIFKDPKTDSKKKSAKGLLFVGYNSDGGVVLHDEASVEEEASEENRLKTIFKNGVFVKRTNLEEIRSRLA